MARGPGPRFAGAPSSEDPEGSDSRSGGERIENRTDAEGRKNVRRDLQAELAPYPPRVVGALIAEINLAAHDHVDELIARGEEFRLDAGRVEWILIAGNTARALEVT